MTCSRSELLFFDWRLLEPGMVVDIAQNCQRESGGSSLLAYTFVRIGGRKIETPIGFVDIEQYCFVPPVGSWVKTVSRRKIITRETCFVLKNILTIEEMVVSSNLYIREAGLKSYDESRRCERVTEAVG